MRMRVGVQGRLEAEGARKEERRVEVERRGMGVGCLQARFGLREGQQESDAFRG